MITVRITNDWESSEHTHMADTYEIIVDQAYSPDVADDLVRRVLSAVTEDRINRRRESDDEGEA